ncbi:MAG: winged helix-turn-helix domain-containing protein [Candidatus Gracilibacteria bacterium]
MHTLIVTPHLMQGSTLSCALKRHNFTSLVVSPLSLSYDAHFEADALLFPHPLIKEQWELLTKFLKNINTNIPLILFNQSEKIFFKEKPLSKLLRQSIFLDESILLSQMPVFIREIIQKSSPPQEVRIGQIILNRTSRCVKFEDQSVELSRKEFYLLELFLLNNGRIISRDYIIDYVWDRRDYVAQNTIDVYVSRLRKKIAPFSSKPIIRTIPCLGYQLDI